jgi:hypothetical protein
MINLSSVIHSVRNEFPALFLSQLGPLVEDKTNLAPLRLLSFFVLVVVMLHFVRHDVDFMRHLLRMMVLVGQHSLEVFCPGIPLSMLGGLLVTSVHGATVIQLASTLAESF